MPDHDASHWSTYNAHQAGREVRPLLLEALTHTGPGAGRVAVDVGCGAGVEVVRLLELGWTVHALDGDEGSLRQLESRHATPDGRLTTAVVDLDDLPELPSADLVHSGYALPFTRPERFAATWGHARDALAPGGVLAVNLFGDRDSWAGEPGMTFTTEAETRALFDGLEIAHFHVQDEDGRSFSGPKHWHVFDVVARRS